MLIPEKPFFIKLFCVVFFCSEVALAADPPTMTHGPILGRTAANSMTVWARTSKPTEFEVRFGTNQGNLVNIAKSATTSWEHDCTGTVELVQLDADTRYFYEVYVGGLRHDGRSSQ